MDYFTKHLSSKEISFYTRLQDDTNFDFVLFPEKIESDTGYFRILPDGNLLGKEKHYFLLAIDAIARFHHFSKGIHFDALTPSQGYYRTSLENTIEYAKQHQISLPDNQIGELRESLVSLQEDTWIIHDDFLSQNVMVDGTGIKIIDWADMRYGFPEHDIGRFLGDIAAEDPHWQKKYYPSDWKPELIQQYLDARQELDPTYDPHAGRTNIRLGELWNYLGPIEMCLKSGDIDSAWFQENLKAFGNT